MRCINNHHTAHKTCHVCRYIAERNRTAEVQPLTDKERKDNRAFLRLSLNNPEDRYLLKFLEDEI
jgi:hypothetical protein